MPVTKHLVSAFLLSVTIVCSGCAPGLGSQLSVDRIPDKESAAPGADYLFKVRVEKLRDIRSNSAVGEIGLRELQPLGDPGLSVRSALEQRLRSQGAWISLFEGPSLGGEIQRWKVQVVPSFPASRAEAVAQLGLELYDISGRLIYRGNYSGTFTAEHPVFSAADIEEVLGSAMGEALDQALDDDRLMEKVHSSGKI